MHYLDIIILVIIIASAIEGGFHGFIYEVCSLVGIVAGFILAIQFFAEVAGFLDFIPIPLWLLKLKIAIIICNIRSIITIYGNWKSLCTIYRYTYIAEIDTMLCIIFMPE